MPKEINLIPETAPLSSEALLIGLSLGASPDQIRPHQGNDQASDPNDSENVGRAQTTIRPDEWDGPRQGERDS